MAVATPGRVLLDLDLPSAPPVTTGVTAPIRRRKGPAVALIVLGVILVFGPIFGGMFAKTAAGNQMIVQFAPYMESSSLARYDHDIGILHAAAVGTASVYRDQDIPNGRYPGLDTFRHDSTAIVGRATTLLHRVKGAQGDYHQVARIGGFDRIPFLIIVSGLVGIYGGGVLLIGRRSRAVPAAVLVVLASSALIIYPFVSGLFGGAQAGRNMFHALSPVMTPHQVRQLQDDFIVLVNADGELSTTFRGVPRGGPSATAITSLVRHWPAVSSDLASLVGVINDNITNFNSLNDLDALTRGVGISGLESFPWALIGIGVVSATLAVEAMPRRGKESQ